MIIFDWLAYIGVVLIAARIAGFNEIRYFNVQFYNPNDIAYTPYYPMNRWW